MSLAKIKKLERLLDTWNLRLNELEDDRQRLRRRAAAATLVLRHCEAYAQLMEAVSQQPAANSDGVTRSNATSVQHVTAASAADAEVALFLREELRGLTQQLEVAAPAHAAASDNREQQLQAQGQPQRSCPSDSRSAISVERAEETRLGFSAESAAARLRAVRAGGRAELTSDGMRREYLDYVKRVGLLLP